MASCPPTQAPVCGAAACGNGFVDSCLAIVGRDCHVATITEDCDGVNFGPRTCNGLGYGTGYLSCTAGCTLDYSNCLECEPVSGLLAACGPSPISPPFLGSFGLAAKDDEIGLAFASLGDSMTPDRLTFARVSPTSFTVTGLSTIDDAGQPGPLYGEAITEVAVAPIATGWVVGVCGASDVYLHAIDASGQDAGRTIVAHATDMNEECQPGTLSLAARPNGGPLLLWETNNGVNAAVVSDDGRSAGTPVEIAGQGVAVFGASAAWVGDAFTVAAGIASPQTGEALRLAIVRPDGTSTLVKDVPMASLSNTPRVVAGAADLRVVYPGVPAAGAATYPLGEVWQRFDSAGGSVGTPIVLATYPMYFGQTPALAFGDDTVVLIAASPTAALAVVRVAPDGGIVSPLQDIVKAPAATIPAFDMVRRGSEAVVGWVSPITGGIQLARVTP
jgi:hypothetical protein